MACILGDETGLIKCVSLEKAALPSVGYQVGVQDRDCGVRSIVEGRRRGEYFASHQNGTVTVLSGAEDGTMPCDSFEMDGTLLPCVSASAMYFDKETSLLSSLDDEGNVQSALISEVSGGLNLESVAGFEVEGATSAVHFFKSEKWGVCLATGGRNTEVRVHQISTGKVVWRAKELPNCSLGLQRKIFPTTACILGNGELFVSTGFNELRRYDLSSVKPKDRRPLIDWVPEFLKNVEVRFFCAQAYKETEVILADNTGSVFRIDVVSKILLMKYRGGAGTARSISVHPTLPFLASAGLARYLYVHDIESGKMVSTVYLKQRLNAAFFLPGHPFKDKYTHAIDESGNTVTAEDVTNEVWMDLLPAAEKPSGKKGTRAAVDDAPSAKKTKVAADSSAAAAEPAKKKAVKRVVKRIVKKKAA